MDPSRPLLDGGLGPGGGHSYVIHAINALAAQQKIPIHKPFEDLSHKQQTILLEGVPGKPGVLGILDKFYKKEIASEAYHDWFMGYMSPHTCPDCGGHRLKPSSLAVKVKDRTIGELTRMSIRQALETVKGWNFTGREKQIGGRPADEIRDRLEFLMEVGLEYLSLERSAATLSGGRSAAHPAGDPDRLAAARRALCPGRTVHRPASARQRSSAELARKLRDLGNTVLVVEHDADTIERADYVIDLGPGAGRLGGELVAQGTPAEIARNPNSLTGQYLTGRAKSARPKSGARAAPGA